MSVFRVITTGVAAGAAGTTTLNAVTYLDMAVRARPASDTPQQAVKRLTAKTGHPVPGQGEEQDNRLHGLGPLTGILTGVAVGAFAGLARPLLRKLPVPLAATLIGAVAMALTDGPLVKLGLTDPTDWSAADWIGDIIPHLAYGAATYTTLQATAG